MVETAQYNGADAILYVNTTLSTEAGGFAETKIRVTVTGLAVKLKADEGYEIQLPPSQLKPVKPVNTELPGTDVVEIPEDTETSEVPAEPAPETASTEE